MEQKKKGRAAGIWKKILIFAIAAFLLYISGCGKAEAYVFQIDKDQCSQQEAKILLLNYQKEYSSSYGLDLWKYDQAHAQKMESYVKELTLTQMAQIFTLDIAADAEGVTLSKEEEKRLSEASKAYYQGLSEEEKNYLGNTEDLVHDLYERYGLAQKLCANLTEEERKELLQKYENDADTVCDLKEWQKVSMDHSLNLQGKSFLSVYAEYFPTTSSENSDNTGR